MSDRNVVSPSIIVKVGIAKTVPLPAEDYQIMVIPNWSGFSDERTLLAYLKSLTSAPAQII